MVRIYWKLSSLWLACRVRVQRWIFSFRLGYFSLFYNQFSTWMSLPDALLEPLFWFVDNFLRYLGPAFVVVVVTLAMAVFSTAYFCLMKEKFEESLWLGLWHCLVGHWLLFNLIFHYFRAAFSNPGQPPNIMPEVVSICKRCIAPKPPRAHHCSVCDQCILKMDHHCPWLNNCVGHHNHRYFFLFCVYMWIGCVYAAYCGFQPFRRHFLGHTNITFSAYLYKRRHYSKAVLVGPQNEMHDVHALERRRSFDSAAAAPEASFVLHHMMVYLYLTVTAVAIALGLLTLWHARLIHRGETSIELHINAKEKKRLQKSGLVFKNPYNFGPLENWKRFLGLTNGRSFWRHVLLPSAHMPDNDGLQWDLNNRLDSSLLLLV